MRIRFIYLLLLISTTINVCGQDSIGLSNRAYFNLEGLSGSTWAHHKSIRYLLEYPPTALNLDVGLYSSGEQAWQRDLDMPRYGIGYQYARLGGKILGNAHSVYAYISSDIISKHKLQWHYKIGAGVGFVDNPYHEEHNPLNIVNGSVVNAYLRISTGFNYFITNKNGVGVNTGLFHLSNGSVALPNWGVNTVYFSVNYTHRLMDSVMTIKKRKNEVSDKNTRITLYGGGGIKEEPPLDGKKFLISDLHINYWRQFRPAYSWGAGLTVFYDESTKKMLWRQGYEGVVPLEEYQIKDHEYLSFGAQAGYMLNMHPVYFSFELGVYLYNAAKKDIYNRWLLEIQVYNNLRIYGGLKSKYGRADFIEYGLAYDLFNSKN